MNRNRNPYPEMITDETSGIRVPNIAYRIWLEGYKAGIENIPSGDKANETDC